MTMIHVPPPRARRVTARQSGTRVHVLIDGKGALDVSWREAEAIARALIAKARAGEEQEKAEAIARDHAILLRAGVPLGLTNDPRIQDEAAKLAVSDRDLRRYMPGGVRSKEMVGTPTVVVGPRRTA